MADNSFLAKLINFAPEHFSFTLQLGFGDEKQYQYFLDLFHDQEFRLFKVREKPKKIKDATDKQIRYWYACVRNILKFYDVETDSENMKTMHLQLKKRYLPVTYIEVGIVQLPLIPSLTELTLEEMAEGLDNLIEDYLKLGLDLRKYTLS